MPDTRLPRQTILVIDDDPAIRDLARDVLAGEGYRVVTAVTHDEAMIALSSFRFSAVLADTAGSVATSSFDRWVELERIRAAAGGAPTVIFSAHNRETFADFAERGFAGVIAKPFDLEEMLATVQATLPKASTAI
jgi:DNA-binding NtrC family response regulator